MFKSRLITYRVCQSFRSYVRRAREPGIDRRLKTFSDDFLENDPETIEAMEPDFMNVGEAHKQFQEEEIHHKQKISSLIVGRKYFKEKGINFLTWSEKEQIRLLSQQDPNKWTPMKLSESFPADPTTIHKIIRNKWQPQDEKRVQKHDEAVKKSWDMLKAEEIEVDPILKEHLKKFAHRDVNALIKPKPNRKLGTQVPRPVSSEFLSIITSCKKYSEKPSKKKEQAPQIESSELKFPKNVPSSKDADSFILEGKLPNSTRKEMSLREYQKMSPDIVLPERNENTAQLRSTESFKKLQTISDEPGVTSLSFDEKKVFQSLEIAETITIPKKQWKKDQIYKVGDCFYSDDGEFLYRVPGLF